jgi:hypothetical protein
MLHGSVCWASYVIFFSHANPTKGIEFPLLRNNGNRYNQVLNYYKRITHAAYC